MSAEQHSSGEVEVSQEDTTTEEVRMDYELMFVGRTSGNVVASKVDTEVPVLERDVTLVDRGRIITNPEPRMTLYTGMLMDAMRPGEVARITSERVFFTLDELQQLSALVHEGRIVRDSRDLIAAKYGSEKLRSALGKRVEEMLPSLEQLLKCLNAELSVEEFLDLLGKKWDM
jgi:hypothetical protein